jgi:hypothetical protein
MATLYPGFLARLDKLGSVRCRAGEQFVVYLPSGKAYTFSGGVPSRETSGLTPTAKVAAFSSTAFRSAPWRIRT